MTMTTDLQGIMAADRVCDDSATLQRYSRDQSFVQTRSPDVVAYAQSVEDVREVLQYANKTNTPVVPYSSGLNLHGATIPKEGGIILDLSRMNKILSIDRDNWSAVIEPGVTVAQLQDELEKHQLRAMLPFGVHPGRSALTSLLERDPAVAAASFEYGNELILDTELVLPGGELFRTGLWSAGGKPGSPMGPVRAMMNRLWTGAQGTLGILTKINMKIEYLPRKRKMFLIPFDSFPEAIEPLRMIQRKEIGHECFMLNNFNLAALLCGDWALPEQLPVTPAATAEFDALREKLPPWLLVLCSNGGPRLPEEKIAYEEQALNEILAISNLTLYEDRDLEELFLAEMLRPWGILKKFNFRGSVHDVAFKTTLHRVPEFQRIVMEVINTYNYPLQNIGVYVLPLERGRAMHCEADFHCDPHNSAEAEQVRAMWTEVSERFIDEGAFFDRPYGAWSDMVYSRAGTYTQKLKELKREMDPNNILNPGHLCF
ncbi:FAD-binding oxidoreductase [Thermodesulfobacteriota bacterium]